MFLEPHGRWRYSLSIFIQKILKNFHFFLYKWIAKSKVTKKTIEKSYQPYDRELLSKKGIKNR